MSTDDDDVPSVVTATDLAVRSTTSTWRTHVTYAPKEEGSTETVMQIRPSFTVEISLNREADKGLVADLLELTGRATVTQLTPTQFTIYFATATTSTPSFFGGAVQNALERFYRRPKH